MTKFEISKKILSLLDCEDTDILIAEIYNLADAVKKDEDE